jgi:DNA processing protein
MNPIIASAVSRGPRAPAGSCPVTGAPGEDRIARAVLTRLAEPADPVLGSILQVLSPGQVLDSIRSGTISVTVSPGEPAAVLRAALARWRARLPAVAPDGGIAAAERAGVRLVCPGESGWPPGLDDLGATRPYGLWARGPADLAACCGQSAAVVGARAATAYGQHVAADIAAGLADRGWAVVSGGAYGIDAAAHRGALDAGGVTVAVLACGPDVPYPRAHHSLLDDITARGAVISEWPPGTPPGRFRFLLRNRVIAAVACGTVVVEAGERSGTLATARHATALGRPLMAVPGPVTSAVSAGCHTLIRDRRAACVTSADITAHLLPALP